MNKKILRYAAIGFILIAVFIFQKHFAHYLSLDFLKSQKNEFDQFYKSSPLLTILSFFTIYVFSTALSLPGAAVLTLAGGALFGLGIGTLVVSIASTTGATLAFLLSRYLFRPTLEVKFADKIKQINEGIKKEGAFYLFALRLIPLFPFFLVNLLMGLTEMRTFIFSFVSLLGMLPGTIAFVNAGSKLSQINSISGILSPSIIFSFVLLGIIPLIGKSLVERIRVKKLYKTFKKPKQFDFNIVVIGGGSAGLVSGIIAATVKAKVALIEKNKMGGDCLNTGCVPSKSLIRSAKIAHYIKAHKTFGFSSADFNFNFSDVMKRVHSIISKIEPHDSAARFEGLGVKCIQGNAEIISPWEVKVNEKILTTKNIIIAAGAEPFLPPIKNLDKIKALTSENLWEITELPQNLLVLGGGAIGCELAQSFARLGSKVTLVEKNPRLLVAEDPDASDYVLKSMKQDNVNCLLNHEAMSFDLVNTDNSLTVKGPNGESKVSFDQCLVAIGRKPRVKGYGLENLKIELNERGFIKTDSFLRTNYPNIYAIGDVNGRHQFTHTAAHHAWYATVNALFSPLKKFKVDESVIPWCTYTDPEVAHVGINETMAKKKNTPYEIANYNLDDLDRAITDSAAAGFVKVLIQPGTDKILGVTVVGRHAGDTIAEFVLAMKYKLGLGKILSTIHIYPTLTEANKFAAGAWRKNHTPKRLLFYVEKFHNWRRS